jgi:hypothetical protein
LSQLPLSAATSSAKLYSQTCSSPLLLLLLLQVDFQKLVMGSWALYLFELATDLSPSSSSSSIGSGSSSGSSSSSSAAAAASLQIYHAMRAPIILTLIEVCLLPVGLPLMEGINHIRGAFDTAVLAAAAAAAEAAAAAREADSATASSACMDSAGSSCVTQLAGNVLRPFLQLLTPAVLCMHPESSSSGFRSGGSGERLGLESQERQQFQAEEAQLIHGKALLALVLAGEAFSLHDFCHMQLVRNVLQ